MDGCLEADLLSKGVLWSLFVPLRILAFGLWGLWNGTCKRDLSQWETVLRPFMSWLVAVSLYRWRRSAWSCSRKVQKYRTPLLGTVFHIPQKWTSVGHWQLRILAPSMCWTSLWGQSSKRTLNPGKLSLSVFHFCTMSVSMLNIWHLHFSRK